jgi:cytosine/adenosine deaminase-related metal-dependent hydrolase
MSSGTRLMALGAVVLVLGASHRRAHGASAAPTTSPYAGCRVTRGSDDFILSGTLLVPSGPRTGALLISGALIRAVGSRRAVVHAAPRATRVDCPRAVVSPGLINAHDHLDYDHYAPQIVPGERYDHRRQWRKGLDGHATIALTPARDDARPIWSELRQVMAGATTAAGSGGRAGLLRNVDRPELREGLPGPRMRSIVFPFGPDEELPRGGRCESVARVNPDAPASRLLLHVGEGTDDLARHELRCATRQPRAGTALVHAIPLTQSEARLMARHGTSLVWSPRSNLALYGTTAAVAMADRRGVNVALSTDWTPTGSMNLLRELRCASRVNDARFAGHFSAEALWRMVTVNAARALGVDDSLGALRVGARGDIAVYDGSRVRDAYRAVVDAKPEDVLLVLRDGRPLYGEASVVEAVSRDRTECERMPKPGVCGAPRSTCVFRETGLRMADLAYANRRSYPLFFCGAPTDEPPCVATVPHGR